MADGIFPSLVSRTRDANAADNVIFTQIADNAGNVATITGGALDVNATVTPEGVYVDDSAFVIATDNVNASGFLADETAPDSVDEGDIGIARMTLDRKQLFVLVDATTDANRLAIDAGGRVTSLISDGTDTLAINADGSINITDNSGSITVDGTVTVTATQLDIDNLNATDDNVAISDGTDTLEINADGSINVNTTIAAVAGATHDYDTAASVASDATSNHDYTVANTTFLLTSVIVSASGNVKFEIQTGPVASLATVAVGFLNGRQGDTQQVFFDPAIPVPATSTGTVRVIRTNRQGAAMDVYSTIVGVDQ